MLTIKSDGNIQIIGTSYDMIFQNRHNYDFIYISIGSKIYQADESAYYQMFPTFLNNKKSLILVIDEFYDDISSDDLNKTAMVTFKQKNDCDLYVISGTFTPTEFVDIYKQLLAHLDDVDPSKYIIANYIRFRNDKNSDSDEMVFYNKHRSELDNLLNKPENTKYLGNIYLWTGYNMTYFKNIIYSYLFYKDHKLFEQAYITAISPLYGTLKLIINSNVEESNINCENIKKIYADVMDKTRDIPRFVKIADIFVFFCKNAIDITCDHKTSKIHLMNGGRKKAKSKKYKYKKSARLLKRRKTIVKTKKNHC